MKTLRQMRIESAISECDKQMEVLLERVMVLKEYTINGQYNPKVAIKKYYEIMKRVGVLNARTWKLTNKEKDFKRLYSIVNFSEYMEFFEL